MYPPKNWNQSLPPRLTYQTLIKADFLISKDMASSPKTQSHHLSRPLEKEEWYSGRYLGDFLETDWSGRDGRAGMLCSRSYHGKNLISYRPRAVAIFNYESIRICISPDPSKHIFFRLHPVRFNPIKSNKAGCIKKPVNFHEWDISSWRFLQDTKDIKSPLVAQNDPSAVLRMMKHGWRLADVKKVMDNMPSTYRNECRPVPVVAGFSLNSCSHKSWTRQEEPMEYR